MNKEGPTSLWIKTLLAPILTNFSTLLRVGTPFKAQACPFCGMVDLAWAFCLSAGDSGIPLLPWGWAETSYLLLGGQHWDLELLNIFRYWWYLFDTSSSTVLLGVFVDCCHSWIAQWGVVNGCSMLAEQLLFCLKVHLTWRFQGEWGLKISPTKSLLALKPKSLHKVSLAGTRVQQRRLS